MNWKTIGQLSLFGLAMGIATVFVIPSSIEPLFWLAIFVVSAYVIARRCPDRPFVHGLLLGLANCVWVTGAHVVFIHQYFANHPQQAAMMSSMPMPDSPRLMMMLVGPVIGVVSGAVIGVTGVRLGSDTLPAASIDRDWDRAQKKLVLSTMRSLAAISAGRSAMSRGAPLIDLLKAASPRIRSADRIRSSVVSPSIAAET
jgi:hypothetical protein